jgi:hypothetical protein
MSGSSNVSRNLSRDISGQDNIMVSRIYQPVYSHRPSAAPSHKPVQANAPEAAPEPFRQTVQPDAPQDRDRPDLATLRDQAEGRRIRLDSVLTDFETTLNAIGVPEDTSQGLRPYLAVVRLQGQEKRPNTTLMKATLLTASKSLDGFIATATGKPSDVVEQWMHSLLAQDIDYNAVSPPDKSDLTVAQPHATKGVPPTAITAASQSVSQWVKAAKSQPPETAIPLLHQALQAATPEQQAPIHHLLARRYWQTGQTQPATEHLSASVNREADPAKQARQRVLLGHWHSQLQQPQQVVDTLAPLWASEQLPSLDAQGQARARLDYGQALLASNPQQHAAEAITHLVAGLKQAQGQPAWVKAALPSLATAYLTVGDTARALKVLQRHSQLS